MVAYTIRTTQDRVRSFAIYTEKKNIVDKQYSVTEYTMSEIIASVYEKIEQTGNKEGILFIDEINCVF